MKLQKALVLHGSAVVLTITYSKCVTPSITHRRRHTNSPPSPDSSPINSGHQNKDLSLMATIARCHAEAKRVFEWWWAIAAWISVRRHDYPRWMRQAPHTSTRGPVTLRTVLRSPLMALRAVNRERPFQTCSLASLTLISHWWTPGALQKFHHTLRKVAFLHLRLGVRADSGPRSGPFFW